MSSKKRNLGDEVFDELDERACLRFEALTSLDGRVGALMRSNQLQTFQVILVAEAIHLGFERLVATLQDDEGQE
tara:strand:- start:134 stop:355 length:222 start_codon:yes stop_codon:yes gene_type:complete